MDRLFLKTLSSVVAIEEKAYPDQILKNILARDFLPRAKKFLSSRPEAWNQLDPKYRPHFTVRLLGLNKTSQETLIRHLCANESEFSQVISHLAAHPNIRELCYNPMYCILITTYILQNKCDRAQLITVTDLFAEVLYQCIKPSYFKSDLQRLKMITGLALSGIAGKEFSFKCNKSDKDDKTLEMFMKVELAKGVRFGEKIFPLKSSAPQHQYKQGRSQTFSFGGATGGASFATRRAVNGLCRTFKKRPTERDLILGGPLGVQAKFGVVVAPPGTHLASPLSPNISAGLRSGT